MNTYQNFRNKNAQKKLKEVLSIYEKEEGATKIGCFRDAITDLLHIAKERKLSIDEQPLNNQDIRLWLIDSAADVFEIETIQSECDKVSRLPLKDLPLHTVDEFEYDDSKNLFETRLKQGK